ncbi:MAG: AAA family ATPase [Myxococcota bacterium]
MEHLQHFGLAQDPFSNESDLRLYFESPSHRDAQRRVERGLRQHKGLTVLTGEGGMGKTLLARRILDGLEEELFEATLLVMLPGAADAMGIFQRFARQLGAEDPARDRAGVLAQIYERLAIVREDGRHAVLIVDDAQVMSPQVFAELGGLLSLEYEDRRLLSMLLVGSPALDRQIDGDPSLLPRVEVRVRVQPLDLRGATAYLMHRLQVARGRPELIPAATVETLFKLGRGRPRLLNTLADNALFEAYLAGRSVMEPSDVERAAGDLGLLGEAWNAEAPAAMRSEPERPVPTSAVRGGGSRPPAGPLRSVEPQVPDADRLDFEASLDLEGEIELDAGEATSDWDAHAVDEIDLDLLAPDPTPASPADRRPSRSAVEPAPGARSSAMAEATLRGDDTPELDGLFVELIEE